MYKLRVEDIILTRRCQCPSLCSSADGEAFDLTSGIQLKEVAQVYDYFITFEREVEFIWPSKWTFIKTLFFVTRYSPFLDVTLDVFREWHFAWYREYTSYSWSVVADHRLEPRRWLVVYLVSRCRSIFQRRGDCSRSDGMLQGCSSLG